METLPVHRELREPKVVRRHAEQPHHFVDAVCTVDEQLARVGLLGLAVLALIEGSFLDGHREFGQFFVPFGEARALGGVQWQ